MRQDGAQRLAAANAAGLGGSFEAFSNSVSTAALTLFNELRPALKFVVDMFVLAVKGIAAFIDVITNLPGPLDTIATVLLGIIVLGKPLMAMFRSLGASMVANISVLTTFNQSLWLVQKTTLVTGETLTGFSAIMKATALTAASVGASLKAAFLSNPVGWAIIGLTTVISTFMWATESATPVVNDFTEAIDQQTGALNDNAIAVLGNKFAKDGQIATAKAAGLADGEYTLAVMNQGDALQKTNQHLLENAMGLIQSSGKMAQFKQDADRANMTLEEYVSHLLTSNDTGATAGVISAQITTYKQLNDDAANLATQQGNVAADR